MFTLIRSLLISLLPTKCQPSINNSQWRYPRSPQWIRMQKKRSQAMRRRSNQTVLIMRPIIITHEGAEKVRAATDMTTLSKRVVRSRQVAYEGSTSGPSMTRTNQWLRDNCSNSSLN
jgi:hypothetical protein